MGQDSKKKNPQVDDNTGTSRFTFTTDKSKETSIPSVTKLLQRKTFDGGTNSGALPSEQKQPKKTPTERPPIPAPLPTPELDTTPLPPPVRSKRRGSRALPSLTDWTASGSADPSMPIPTLATALISRGVDSLLYLVQKGSKSHPLTANYVAAAHYQLGKKRLALCTGIHLNAAIAPDLWDQIFKSNFIELTPNPSTESIHFMREALGVEEKEHVILHRFAKGADAHGVLVIYSRNSFAGELTTLLSGGSPNLLPPPLPELDQPPKRKRTGKTGLFKRAA